MSVADSRVRPWRGTDTTAAATRDARRDVRIALLLLLVVHSALLLGFHRFVQILRAWPVRPVPGASSDRDIQDVPLAVDRACTYYPKYVRCLHRSAVVVAMLRRRGHAASLVIGIQKLPFAAHAWVELDGVVVNDRQSLRADHLVIETIAAERRRTS